jgi:hypothetical protein
MRTVKSYLAVAATVAGVFVGGSGTASSAATTLSCTPAQMVVTRGMTNGAAGTIYHVLIFTDTGGSCALWGVPAIQPVVGPSHRALGPAAANASMGVMPARHVLTRGRSVSVAYAVVETGNFSAASCKPKNADGVLVSLSPFVRSTYVKMAISVCTARVSTRSRLITPGRTGV